MEFRYLKAFLSAATHGHFTKAGEELGIAQSAISRQVRLLEESLGQQLLIRSPQRVIMTPAGRALFNKVAALEEWQKAYFHRELSELRIGVMSGILDNWLLSKLFLTKKDLPLNLHIDVGTVDTINQSLKQGKIDAGLMTAKIESEDLSSLQLFEEDFALISKTDVDTKKLHEHRWIYGNNGSYLQKCAKKRSSKFIRVNSTHAIIELVKNGLGIAIVPTHLVENKKGLKVLPLKKLGRGKVYLCTPNYRIQPEALKVFRQILQL